MTFSEGNRHILLSEDTSFHQQRLTWVAGVSNYGSGPLSHLENIVKRMETTFLPTVSVVFVSFIILNIDETYLCQLCIIELFAWSISGLTSLIH